MPTKYAFITDTFDAEYMLLIRSPDGRPIVTVAQPAGPVDPQEFCLWVGAPDGACEDSPDMTFRVNGFDGVADAWNRAVQAAYDYAIRNAD